MRHQIWTKNCFQTLCVTLHLAATQIFHLTLCWPSILNFWISLACACADQASLCWPSILNFWPNILACQHFLVKPNILHSLYKTKFQDLNILHPQLQTFEIAWINTTFNTNQHNLNYVIYYMYNILHYHNILWIIVNVLPDWIFHQSRFLWQIWTNMGPWWFNI